LQRTKWLDASDALAPGSTTICAQKSQYLAIASGTSLVVTPEMVAMSPSLQLVFPESRAAAAMIWHDRSSSAREGAQWQANANTAAAKTSLFILAPMSPAFWHSSEKHAAQLI